MCAHYGISGNAPVLLARLMRQLRARITGGERKRTINETSTRAIVVATAHSSPKYARICMKTSGDIIYFYGLDDVTEEVWAMRGDGYC